MPCWYLWCHEYTCLKSKCPDSVTYMDVWNLHVNLSHISISCWYLWFHKYTCFNTRVFNLYVSTNVHVVKRWIYMSNLHVLLTFGAWFGTTQLHVLLTFVTWLGMVQTTQQARERATAQLLDPASFGHIHIYVRVHANIHAHTYVYINIVYMYTIHTNTCVTVRGQCANLNPNPIP